MVQAWCRRGAKVAQKWLKSRKIDLDGRIENQTGNVQAWRERGASVARAWRRRGAGVTQAWRKRGAGVA